MFFLWTATSDVKLCNVKDLTLTINPYLSGAKTSFLNQWIFFALVYPSAYSCLSDMNASNVSQVLKLYTVYTLLQNPFLKYLV